MRGKEPKRAARKRSETDRDPVREDMRNQEVLRANRELAAYFKGRRTEREARAALKIIKAFIRTRERTDPANQPPLPAAASRQRTSQRREQRVARKPRPRKPADPRQSAGSMNPATPDVGSGAKPPRTGDGST
jgi:hypothetical protein